MRQSVIPHELMFDPYEAEIAEKVCLNEKLSLAA